MERGIEAIRQVTGRPPVGYRSPAWDLSPHTLDLLLGQGFLYDSSLMAQDFVPYYCRVGDQASQDGPYVFGREIELVEISVTWGLDDTLHPQVIGRGHRLLMLERLLQHMRERSGVLFSDHGGSGAGVEKGASFTLIAMTPGASWISSRAMGETEIAVSLAEVSRRLNSGFENILEKLAHQIIFLVEY